MFEINKQAFGTFVAQLRKERGYTQKELAEKLFVSDKAVSKWETGVSIPDTALLVPLAELLDVTVTEMLLCRRVQEDAALDPQQVDGVVKTALSYPEEAQNRAWQIKSWWPAVYIISAVVGGGLALLCCKWQGLWETTLTAQLLGLIFGAYFCFLVKTRLPRYYDENACGFYHDGPFRMNVPGVRFSNSNWPHVVQVGRIWSCAVLALAPAVDMLGLWSLGAIWPAVRLWVWLALLLGGLFVPMYVVGKKYE